MEEKIELNVLVLENNYSHVVHARNNLKETEKKLNLNFLGEIYPNKESISRDIARISENVNDNIATVEILFKYIEKLIDDYKIDIILLDFLLSETEETEERTRKPHDTTGGKLLKNIKNNYPDLAVVSYSKIADRIDTSALVGSQILFHLDKNFNYNFFTKNLSQLFKMINEGKKFRYIHKRSCDIAIICALSDELQAIRDLSLNWEELNIEGKIYYCANLGEYKVIATSEDKMGMPEAASLTTRVIDIFSPKYVVMTGIAAGIDFQGQSFLDLLIPDRIFNWQSGKYKVKTVKNDDLEEKDLHIFAKDHRSVETYFDHDNAINLKKDDISNEILKIVDFNSFKIDRPTNINIFSEGMVSGSAVVADKDITDGQIVERKIYGIDMEAYGVVFACNNHPRKPKPIIIKAISDFADRDKNDDVQPAGMHVSAVAFQVLFEKFISSQS